MRINQWRTVMNSEDGMITEHFSWQEAFHTNHREIQNNWPDDGILVNVARVAVKAEKVREILGAPMIVTSWYRNAALNAAVGGAEHSDHLSGCAIDFLCPQLGKPVEVVQRIAANANLIGFKQLILEHNWVHISWEAIPGVVPKLEILSLLEGGGFAKGITDKAGKSIV